jgi:hypothetical protein
MKVAEVHKIHKLHLMQYFLKLITDFFIKKTMC